MVDVGAIIGYGTGILGILISIFVLVDRIKKKAKESEAASMDINDLKKRMTSAEEHMEKCPAYRVVEDVADIKSALRPMLNAMLVLLRKARNEKLNGEVDEALKGIDEYLINK